MCLAPCFSLLAARLRLSPPLPAAPCRPQPSRRSTRLGKVRWRSRCPPLQHAPPAAGAGARAAGATCACTLGTLRHRRGWGGAPCTHLTPVACSGIPAPSSSRPASWARRHAAGAACSGALLGCILCRGSAGACSRQYALSLRTCHTHPTHTCPPRSGDYIRSDYEEKQAIAMLQAIELIKHCTEVRCARRALHAALCTLRAACHTQSHPHRAT